MLPADSNHPRTHADRLQPSFFDAVPDGGLTASPVFGCVPDGEQIPELGPRGRGGYYCFARVGTRLIHISFLTFEVVGLI